MKTKTQGNNKTYVGLGVDTQKYTMDIFLIKYFKFFLVIV